MESGKKFYPHLKQLSRSFVQYHERLTSFHLQAYVIIIFCLLGEDFPKPNRSVTSTSSNLSLKTSAEGRLTDIFTRSPGRCLSRTVKTSSAFETVLPPMFTMTSPNCPRLVALRPALCAGPPGITFMTMAPPAPRELDSASGANSTPSVGRLT
mmetsp:Transcript_106970/g.190204  ORF Transcript_106970/g.190204 Transcript_106970/m.190204 type:complete len:153 (+) Transcript_106970:191-649(+)